MKFKSTLKLHKRLVQELGKDLVYSVSYDEGKYYLSISVHKSDTWEYNHGGNIQTCHIDDFNDDVDALVKKVLELYHNVLVKKEQEDEVE